MLSLKTVQLTSAPLISLFISGCLVIIPEHRPVQAQIVNRKLILAQTGLPQLQPQTNQIVEFNQNNQNYPNIPSTQISQSGETRGRYIVYVNSDNNDILQRVRQVESTAYIRQLNGSRIIQSGVFTKPENAQRRVRQLEVYGITNTGILDFSNPGSRTTEIYNPGTEFATGNYYNEVQYNNNQNNPNINYNNNPNIYNISAVNQRSRYYYVVIPTSSDNLQSLGQELQQRIGGNANIYLRTQPRGTHIAVGAFEDRSQAVQWNNFLKSLGYGNARVYYGQ